MMIKGFQKALADAQQWVRVYDSPTQGLLWEGSYHLSLGNALAAPCRCWRALELYEHAQAQWKFRNANTGTEDEKTAGTDFENRDFWEFVSCTDCALEFAPACHCFRIIKEYLAVWVVIQKPSMWPVTFCKWISPLQLLCIMKVALRKWFGFLYSLSGWLMTMRTPALFVEMPKSTQKR